MRIVVVGARGSARRGGRARVSSRPRGRRLRRAPSSTSATIAPSRRRWIARDPTSIVNCAAYNDVDGAEDHPVDALNVNAFAVRALARPPRTTARRSSTTAPTSCSTAPRPRRTPKTIGRTRAACTPTSKLLGEWFALDAPRAYVLRVESLFGRAPGAGPAKGSVAGIVRTLQAGGTREGVRGPHGLADVHHRRRARDAAADRVGGADRACITASTPARAPGSSSRRSWRALLGVEPRLEPVRMADMKLRAPRPLYCALSNAKLRRAGVDDAGVAGRARAATSSGLDGRRPSHVTGRRIPGRRSNVLSGRSISSASSTRSRHQFADREARRQARRIDAGGLHHRGVLAIAPDQEIGKRLVRRMQLRADAAAGQPQVVDGDAIDQVSAPTRRTPRAARDRSRSRLSDPDTGWSARATPVRRSSDQVNAEAVAGRVRQRIDQRVDERSFRRRELGVFAAARDRW